MIIAKITRQNTMQVRLIEDDYVVKTLTTDWANDSFGKWILPSQTGSGQDLLDTHRSNTILETDAI
jgi:hypothetical protein